MSDEVSEPGRRIVIKTVHKTSAGMVGSDLARAPTRTLTHHVNARSILAAGSVRVARVVRRVAWDVSEGAVVEGHSIAPAIRQGGLHNGVGLVEDQNNAMRETSIPMPWPALKASGSS